jgi:hypothetical protein
MVENLTPQEEAELAQYLTGSTPVPEEKHNIHKFLHDVSISDDTTKTGFLSEDELGTPEFPVRSSKNLALFCNKIADMPYFSEYFLAEAEIVTATSLSKKGKLLDTAVVSRRQLEDVTKPKKRKGGLFGKKKDKDDDE